MSLVAVVVAAAVALAAALISLVAATRFRAGLLIPREVPAVPVTLILAATGKLPDLEALFDRLLAQTLRPRRLVVAVESRDDPAYGRVAGLAAAYPALAIELVVAGVSDARAQKLTNLLAAFARLGDGDRFIAMFDADIRPQPWWLAALAAPLAAGRADIVSGYRWPFPATPSPGSIIVAAIDRAVAVLPRLARFRTLWGGSLALTRAALDRLDMTATLAHALTEDLVIADRAAALGLRMVIRRGVRVPTPLRATTGDAWRFARRQMQQIRLYRPLLWSMALLSHTADLLARLTLVAAAIAGAPTVRLIGAASLVALAGLGAACTQIRIAVGARLEAPDRPGSVIAQHLVAVTILPDLLFYVSAIWASAIHSPVVWSHVRYRVARNGRVLGAERAPHRRA